MAKNLLVTCGGMPHIIEFMIPTIKEAVWRGWKIYGAYADQGVRTTMEATRLFFEFGRYAGKWDEAYKVITIPQADPIFEWANPDAVLIDFTGQGTAGGAWVDEIYKRKITAVELRGPNKYVLYYGPTTRDLTAKFLERLHELGYGGQPVECLTGTDAQQFVGFIVGDQLLKPFDPRGTKKKLGLGPNQRIITLVGNWSKGGYQEICEEDFVEWNAMAKANDAVLVFSPHPVMRMVPWMQEISIPEDVPIASNYLGKFGERSVKFVPITSLVRASSFLVFQYDSAIVDIGLAARVPMWLRRGGTGRNSNRSRTPLAKEEDSFTETISRKFWDFHTPENTIRRAMCWRTAEHLEQLFEGRLGCKAPEDMWRQWCEDRHLRLDGHTTKRIVDLLET